MISVGLKLLLFMGLWLSVVGKEADVIAMVDSQGEVPGTEMDLIREPFPFATFSLPSMERNSTVLLSFPIPAFNSTQQVNVSLTVDDTFSSPNHSQVILLHASICEGRSGNVLINTSSNESSVYFSVVLIPRSLFPDDLDCIYNASDPKLFVKLEGTYIQRGVNGTVAVRLVDDASNETTLTTPIGHRLHLREEVALSSNDFNAYPLPILPSFNIGATSLASEIDIGVRRGRVEIWLASTDPACHAAFEGSEELLENTRHEGKFATLMKMDEAGKGDRLAVKINATLIETFQQLELKQCVERDGQLMATDGVSEKSRGTTQKIGSFIGVTTSEPVEVSLRPQYTPSLVVLALSPSTAVYSIYATIQHPAHDEKHLPPSNRYSLAVIIPIILTALFVVAVFATVGVLYWREKRRQRRMRYTVQREVIILKAFRNNSLSNGPGVGGVNEAFEGLSINDGTNGVSSTASTATIAETSFGGAPSAGEMHGISLANANDGHDNSTIATRNVETGKKGGGRFVLNRIINVSRGPDLSAWKL